MLDDILPGQVPTRSLSDLTWKSYGAPPTGPEGAGFTTSFCRSGTANRLVGVVTVFHASGCVAWTVTEGLQVLESGLSESFSDAAEKIIDTYLEGQA